MLTLQYRACCRIRPVSQRPIDNSIYSYQPTLPVRPVRGSRLSARAARMVRGAVAASICLLAHVFLYETVIWTAGTPAPVPQYLPARISVSSDSDQEALQWIALDPQALTDASRQKRDLPSAQLQRIDVPKDLKEVAVVVQDMELPPTPEATVADAGRLSKMYGRYVGQISSRIERAWMRPRTPIGAASFSCQVRVIQDAIGNVMEVTLVKCNGDARWQLSLVQAIQSASPLPAPPDPDVFSRTVHLAFSGEAYTPQSLTDQYESLASASVAQAAHDARRADDVLAHFSDSRAAGMIRLNIAGNRETVERQNDGHADVNSTNHADQQ
jgi:TonB C terminal